MKKYSDDLHDEKIFSKSTVNRSLTEAGMQERLCQMISFLKIHPDRKLRRDLEEALRRAVAVPEVHPAGTVICEHPMYFVKKGEEMLKILVRSALTTELARRAKVAQAKVGRRRDHAVHAAVGDAAEELRAVPNQKFVDDVHAPNGGHPDMQGQGFGVSYEK